MKRLATFVVIIGVLLIASGSGYWAEANNNSRSLTGILQKIEKAHQDLKSLKAAIKQQRVNVQVNAKDTDYGTLLYKPAAGKAKGKLRIDYTKPDTRIVAVIGNSFTFYQPRINQVVKTTLARASNGKTNSYTHIIGLDSSAKDMAKDYNIEYVKEETIDNQMATQLHLTPKSGGPLKEIDIWVSHQSWLPVQQKFTERNGDYTIVQLTNLEPNIKLSDEAFNVKYPNTTVVVDKI